MTQPQNQDDQRGWVAKSRDGILLVLGVAMIVTELIGNVAFNRSVDPIIMATAGALVGIVPILQKESK
jgi:predicted MFS family arabinose efflux permease